MDPRDDAVDATPAAGTAGRGPRIRRFLRALVLRGLAAMVLLVALVFFAVLGLLRSEGVARRVLERAMPAVNEALPGTIEYGGFSGGLGHDFTLQDVTIRDETGDAFITATSLALQWEVLDLVSGNLTASRLDLRDPVFVLKQREDRSLNVVTAFVKPRTAPPEPKTGDPKPLPFDIEVSDVRIHNGAFVFEKADGRRIVDVQEIGLDASYSLRGFEHDAAFRDLRAKLDAPLEIPRAQLDGGARMHDLVLDLDGITLRWKDDEIGLSGTLGKVSDLDFDARLDVRRFDLADVKEFAPSAPLQGLVTGPLHVKGPLADLVLDGALTTRKGGKVDIADLGVRLVSPLEHHLDVTLTELELGELLDVPQLPPALTGRVTWEGRGTRFRAEDAGDPLILKGTATAKLGPVKYQKMLLGPIDLAANLDNAQVGVDRLAVGLAGGTPVLRGDIDLTDRCFDVRLGGGVAALQQLKERIVAPVTAGRVTLDALAKGCWSTDSDVVALRTSGTADVADLALTPAETRVKAAKLGWTLDIAIPKAPTRPLMRGPVTLNAQGVTAAKQVVDSIALTGALTNTRFTIQALDAASGPDLGLGLAGYVDWGAMPTLAIHGDRLRATYRGVGLETTQAFDFRLREGAIEASGLVANADKGGKLIVQGTVDPEGDTDALLRLLTFNLVQTDAFLPEDGKLRGELQDLTIKVTGASNKPGVSLKTRLRQFATRGKGPIDLDLDLTLSDGVIAGKAALSKLLTLEVSRFPITLRLDGKGGLPVSLPPEAEIGAVLSLLDGPLDRFEAPLGARLPRNYEGGRVRGEITLAGTTTNPKVGGAVLLRDLVVDLTNLEARAEAMPAAETETTRQVTLQAAYALEDGVFALRDTRLKTVAEGTVVEVGARAMVPLGDFLMAIAGPLELRREVRPDLVTGLEVNAALRRLPMSLVHLLSPVTEPVSGAIDGKLVVSGAMTRPELQANFQLLGARVRDRALKRVKLDAGVAGGKLSAQLELVPELLDGELEASVSAPEPTRKPTTKKQKAAAAEQQRSAREKAAAMLAANPDAGRLVVRAESPLPLVFDGSRTAKQMLGQPGLHGEIRSDGFPLPILLAFLPGALDIGGQLDLSGTVEGSLLDPKPDVRLVLNGGRFKYQKTSVSYENIDLDVGFSAAGVDVRTAALDTLPLIRNPFDLVFKPNVSKEQKQTEKRNLEIGGKVALDGWKLGDFALDIRARRLWAIYTQEIKAQVGAGLKVSGRWPDIAVKGEVDVDEVNIDMGQETFGHSVGSMTLPTNIQVHRATDEKKKVRGTFAPVVREDGSSLLDNFDANVLVRLGNKVRVKLAMGIAKGRDDALRALNMIGSIEPEVNVGGEVRVEVRDGKPKFVGAIEVTRDSKLTALTKKFDIRPGSTVTLIGELLDSQLDVIADHPSRYGSIQVKVGGRLGAPEIEFSSEELPDQGDIMAVLVTGKPLSEQTSAEGGSLWSTVSSALAGFGTKLLGKYTPLDKLDIDLGDDLSSGSVEAGKALTPELFLLSRFRWGVEDERENRVEAEVQFRPRGLRRFSIEASIGDRLAGGVQIVWRVLY
jgi:uncharacterized protein involved in high-affinity Fe2+ transport